MDHVGSHPFGERMRIERYRLADNGLQVLVLVDRAAPVVAYQTWFKVGSRHERPGKTGIAHLFEHLMFGGTAKVPHGELDRRLEEVGADSNAATFLDWTYYLVNLPAEALELVVELEADRMHNLVLHAERLESEREVVLNERRQTVDNDLEGTMVELLFSNAFTEHPYRFPIIGFADDIAGLSLEDCRSFYATYYAPNNACLVVVGDVDAPRLLGEVERRYGTIASAPIPREAVIHEPPQRAERRVRTEKPTASSKLLVGYPAPALSDADHAPISLMNEILFGGRASRVHRRLVSDLEVASQVSGVVGGCRDRSLYDMALTAYEGIEGTRVLEALDEVLDGVVAEPPTVGELERARAKVELSTLQMLETASGKAEQIGFSESVLGDPAAIFARLEAYARVTTDDLWRVSQQYLRRDARTLVEVAPLAEAT